MTAACVTRAKYLAHDMTSSLHCLPYGNIYRLYARQFETLTSSTGKPPSIRHFEFSVGQTPILQGQNGVQVVCKPFEGIVFDQQYIQSTVLYLDTFCKSSPWSWGNAFKSPLPLPNGVKFPSPISSTDVACSRILFFSVVTIEKARGRGGGCV